MERAGVKLLQMIGMAYVILSGIDDVMRLFGPVLAKLKDTGGG